MHLCENFAFFGVEKQVNYFREKHLNHRKVRVNFFMRKREVEFSSLHIELDNQKGVFQIPPPPPPSNQKTEPDQKA